jgi:hypothetical protein
MFPAFSFFFFVKMEQSKHFGLIYFVHNSALFADLNENRSGNNLDVIKICNIIKTSNYTFQIKLFGS